MNKLTVSIVISCLISLSTFSQTITDLINTVNQDSLVKVIREFSGEDATVVNGNPVTLLNRVESNNDVAANYIKQKFMQLNNLTITDQSFNTNGRNIIATQLGKTNPNNIYIVCGHYDSYSTANYCVDDNASGTTAVLEIARILSSQCFDNTIVYALWDEEEIGLNGAGYYAGLAATNGDNILGVLNIDMMAYDGDGDNDFDIDVQSIANSLAIKDGLIAALSTYGFNLNANVINPGTPLSDHKRFWDNGFSAVLLGESWSNNDQTPFYHTSNDRFSTLDMSYFTDMTKLALAYMATVGGLVSVDNTVSITSTTLTSNQIGAAYQWLDCDNNNAIISSATNQSFVPTSNGNYAVQISSGSCTEISNCINFNTLNLNGFNKHTVAVYPNPATSVLNIDLPISAVTMLKLLSVNGKEVLKKTLNRKHNAIDLAQLSNGIYFINLEAEGKTVSFKIVKE